MAKKSTSAKANKAMERFTQRQQEKNSQTSSQQSEITDETKAEIKASAGKMIEKVVEDVKLDEDVKNAKKLSIKNQQEGLKAAIVALDLKNKDMKDSIKSVTEALGRSQADVEALARLDYNKADPKTKELIEELVLAEQDFMTVMDEGRKINFKIEAMQTMRDQQITRLGKQVRDAKRPDLTGVIRGTDPKL